MSYTFLCLQSGCVKVSPVRCCGESRVSSDVCWRGRLDVADVDSWSRIISSSREDHITSSLSVVRQPTVMRPHDSSAHRHTRVSCRQPCERDKFHKWTKTKKRVRERKLRFWRKIKHIKLNYWNWMSSVSNRSKKLKKHNGSERTGDDKSHQSI